ncbi:hypothetical protein PM082_005081 [Marasmius tenuissimus]|nr:hypothetical protein PM082_005081 [Marasmius tenuissimus]
MYFNKLFALSAMTTLAGATAVVKRTGGGEGNCSLQCCNRVEKDPNDAKTLIAFQCSPISVAGVANGACSAKTVYCENNSSSLISIGCIVVQP